MFPENGRAAGIAKAEKAINDLTDAAGQLGIAERATAALVSLWNLFHRGQRREFVRHKLPKPGKPDSGAAPRACRGRRCNLERIDSAEGQAALQNVLLGLLTQREAARNLGVHPTTLGLAVRQRRREAAADPTPTRKEIQSCEL